MHHLHTVPDMRRHWGKEGQGLAIAVNRFAFKRCHEHTRSTLDIQQACLDHLYFSCVQGLIKAKLMPDRRPALNFDAGQ
jgi:hypothetical protein